MPVLIIRAASTLSHWESTIGRTVLPPNLWPGCPGIRITRTGTSLTLLAITGQKRLMLAIMLSLMQTQLLRARVVDGTKVGVGVGTSVGGVVGVGDGTVSQCTVTSYSP